MLKWILRVVPALVVTGTLLILLAAAVGGAGAPNYLAFTSRHTGNREIYLMDSSYASIIIAAAATRGVCCCNCCN